MSEEGPRYHRAAECAATICNLYLNTDMPKAQAYGRILYAILAAIYAAEDDLGRTRPEPSEN